MGKQRFTKWKQAAESSAACLIRYVRKVIIVYIFLQKYIIKGMTAGAVKG